MSDPTLIVEVTRGYEWRLVWYFPDENDTGATFGDEGESTGQELFEQNAGYSAAKLTHGCERDKIGFYWNTEPQAKRAKTAINAAIKSARSKRPLPDWAIKAIAAGWKAPKGWKP